MKYFITIIVGDIDRKDDSKFLDWRWKTRGIQWNVNHPTGNYPHYFSQATGSIEQVEMNRRQAAAFSDELSGEIMRRLGYEVNVSINFIPIRKPAALYFSFMPDDRCKGCGVSASRLETVLDPDGYHYGCRWQPAAHTEIEQAQASFKASQPGQEVTTNQLFQIAHDIYAALEAKGHKLYTTRRRKEKRAQAQAAHSNGSSSRKLHRPAS